MKHTLLIALLGATVTLTTPSLSFADNGYKFKSNTVEHKHQKSRANRDRRQHRNDHKKFVAKPPKPHRVIKQIERDLNKKRRHNDRRFVKNKHHDKHNKHYRHNNQRDNSFSITWNVGDARISYGNDWYDYNRGYQKHRKVNHGKRIYQRIHRQANRIQNGIHSGQLVKREARKLRREQRHIKQTMAHYKNDGHLNRYERSKMNQLLDIASDNIYRKKHNRLTRYSRHNNHYVQF